MLCAMPVSLYLTACYEGMKKSSDEKSVQFVECLGNMAVAGIKTNVVDYSTEWFDTVNRGGLFPLNDEAFIFFAAVEVGYVHNS